METLTTYDETRAAVDSKLTDWKISFTARLLGETKRDDWVCDEWRVSLGAFETSYFTGIGLRKPTKATIARAKWSGDKPEAVPVAPKAADVLHSLLLDSEAINESFADWCSNYGYSDDSLKALDTYHQCCAIGEAMRKIFTHEQRNELRAMLEDF